MLKKTERGLLVWPVVLLLAITISTLADWQQRAYIVYAFFVSWGILFIYYIARLANFYSIVLAGMAMGALGLYFSATENAWQEQALLVGRISLTVFVILLGVRLYKMRSEIESNSMLYLALLVLLLFQVLALDVAQLTPLSLAGFSNYFTLGLIFHILLNTQLSRPLREGEKKILLVQGVFCLYNIMAMLLYNFA